MARRSSSELGPAAACSPARSTVFNGAAAAHPPRLRAPRRRRPTRDVDAFAGELIPVYPATATMQTWKIGNAVEAGAGRARDPQSRPVAGRAARSGTRLLGLARGASGSSTGPAPRRRTPGASTGCAATRRSCCRWCSPSGGAAVAALPATPRGRVRRRPAGRVRRAAAVRADRRASARSAAEITADLGRDHPMHRLLQGEVGSGKTVVALRAMLAVVDAGGQAALLAPTEVLAQQHHRSITAMLGPLAERGLLGGAEAGHPGRAAHRLAARGRPPRDAARRRVRRGGHRHRHPRPARGHGRVRRPRAGRRRRAAPVRRRAAGRAARQGRPTRRTCW